ncbi:hypothetical protein [Halarchaeum sp. P4]|uniref:hypothetical protein n=1 Tax=Halarchaeum sp. P4 TaxID=3421639 RepID=UPI003EB8D54E
MTVRWLALFIVGVVFVALFSSGIGSVIHGSLGVYGPYGNRVTWEAVTMNPAGLVVAAVLGLAVGAWRGA